MFYFAEGKVRGYTVNISETGMLVEFDRAPDDWLTGRILAQVGEWRMSVEVQVIRVEERMTAFAFREMSDEDRTRIQKLVEGGTKGSPDPSGGL
jgi:c-di-GMP-binding flagellar brake protein YcgR